MVSKNDLQQEAYREQTMKVVIINSSKISNNRRLAKKQVVWTDTSNLLK